MAGQGASLIGEAPKGPEFYQPPEVPPDITHGDVIWSMPLEGPAALEAAGHNELVLYWSEAVDGTAIGVSGIIALPPTAPSRGCPVVSWAHGTVGLGGKCAPSRDSEEEVSGCKCRVELSEENAWGGIPGDQQFLGSLANRPTADQWEFLRQLKRMNPALKIQAPIRIAHAQDDLRIEIVDTNTLIGELGALGNDVTYRIYPEVADAIAASVRKAVYLMIWMSQRALGAAVMRSSPVTRAAPVSSARAT